MKEVREKEDGVRKRKQEEVNVLQVRRVMYLLL
jgi:hypothetical protein